MVEPDQVEAFLLANPDFLVGKERLISQIRIPHKPDGAVSLIEHQVSLLRNANNQLNQSVESYTAIAEANTEIYRKVAGLILLMMDHEQDFQMLCAKFRDYLLTNFSCNACSLIIAGDDSHEISTWVRVQPESEVVAQVGHLLGAGPVLGMLREEDRDFIYGSATTAQVTSSAVIPFRHKEVFAVFTIGSEDGETFQSGMGTLFLTLITDVLARVLLRARSDVASST